MHAHLDPVGGVAGDMFVAALLDAWPALAGEVPALLRLAGLPDTVTARILSHRDHGLMGVRFQVTNAAASHDHPHVLFRHIREQLAGSRLPPGVKARAGAIFALLADAEAAVHGIPADDVAFHEVGAWDSIADIVAAACLIDSLPITAWSVGPLPLGSGRVHTAHGLLPVPAPATVKLLEGFAVYDDGGEGERITPTGAAILKHLNPACRLPGYPLLMKQTGIGFGARRFEAIPNILRVLVLESPQSQQTEEAAVIHFEVDDQPAEDLAVALERLRQVPGVIDVLQAPVVGKQGRLTAQIQLLARPAALDRVVEQCFIETTTLGLRWQIVHRSVLERRMADYRIDRERIQVKVARRPGDLITAKAEIRDVAEIPGGYAERMRRRQTAEQAILNKVGADDEE